MKIRVRQQIRVVPERILRKVTVNAVKPDRELRREPVRRQKFNEPPDAGLAAEAVTHLSRLFLRDARDLREPFRLIFQNVKARRAEAGDDLLRRLGADALDRAGRQKRKDLRLRLRHEPF